MSSHWKEYEDGSIEEIPETKGHPIRMTFIGTSLDIRIDGKKIPHSSEIEADMDRITRKHLGGFRVEKINGLSTNPRQQLIQVLNRIARQKEVQEFQEELKRL